MWFSWDPFEHLQKIEFLHECRGRFDDSAKLFNEFQTYKYDSAQSNYEINIRWWFGHIGKLTNCTSYSKTYTKLSNVECKITAQNP
jgi:hypothetical protein